MGFANISWHGSTMGSFPFQAPCFFGTASSDLVNCSHSLECLVHLQAFSAGRDMPFPLLLIGMRLHRTLYVLPSLRLFGYRDSTLAKVRQYARFSSAQPPIVGRRSVGCERYRGPRALHCLQSGKAGSFCVCFRHRGLHGALLPTPSAWASEEQSVLGVRASKRLQKIVAIGICFYLLGFFWMADDSLDGRFICMALIFPFLYVFLLILGISRVPSQGPG